MNESSLEYMRPCQLTLFQLRPQICLPANLGVYKSEADAVFNFSIQESVVGLLTVGDQPSITIFPLKIH